MWKEPLEVLPKPRYQGTVICPHCRAEYRPGPWVYGYYKKGTADDFVTLGNVPENVCPRCRKPGGE